MAYVPPLNGGRINATISGNTAGAGALVSTGTLTLAGGNNITLSQAGNAVTISGPNLPSAASNTLGMSNIGNTSGTTGVVSGSALQYAFAGGNNITLSQSLNGVSGTLTISAASQTAQTQSNIQGLYDGANSISTGTVRLSNANGISFGINGQTLTASHNALTSQSNQTLAFSAGNNTSLTSTGTFDARSMFLNGLGAATVGFSSSSLFVSTPVQTAQTQSNIQALYDGANSISTGTVRLSNANGISFGINGNTLTASIAAQTNQTIGIYASGNTTATAGGGSTSSGVDARSLSISAAGALSGGFSSNSVYVLSAPVQSVQTQNLMTVNGTQGNVSISGGANVTVGNNASTITISVAAQSNQSAGIYASGANTIGQSSSSTYDARSLNISGQGALSAGWSGSTLQLSAPVQSAQTQSNIQAVIASGSTNATGTISFANSNNITFGLSNNTITASFAAQSNQTAGIYASGANTIGQSSSSTYDARSLNISGMGALSAGWSGSTLQLSAPVQSVQTQNLMTVNGTQGAVSISGGANITVGNNASTITISAAAQSNQTLGIYASGANTIGQSSSSTYDARSLNISGQGAVSAGWSGSTLQISAPTQTAQTQSNIQAVIASGSTNATGTISFANSNNITFGLSNNTITASFAGGGGGIALSNSQTMYTSGTAKLIEAGGAITIASTTGQQFNFSVPATSSLSATGALSVSTNGATISMGVPAQTNQTLGIYATGANTIGQSSSSTFDARSLNISGQGALSAGWSGSTLQMSAPATSSLLATGALSISSNGSTISFGAPAFSIGQTNSGNSANTSGTVSGQMLLVGGNNITLSQSNNGASATITIAGGAGGAAGSNTLGMSNLGNTSGTSGVVSGSALQLAFAGGNNIVLSQSLNGSSGTITISASAQSNQTISFSAGSQSTLTAAGTMDARSFMLNGVGAASVGFSQSSAFVSVPVQSAQTQSNIQGVIASGSTNTTGNISFANSNNITFGLSNNTITASFGGGGGGIALSAGGTSYGTGTVSLSAAGGMTISGTNNQTLTLSVPASSSLAIAGALTASTNGNTISLGAPAFSAGVSNLSNDSGNTGIQTNRVVFAGGSNITLSQSTNASGATITINGTSGGGGGGIALSAGGTGYTSGTVSLSAAGAIVISGTNNQTITISAPATSSLALGPGITASTAGNTMTLGVPMFSGGVSNLGNTSGNTGTVTNQVVLAGGNNITLSQSTNATGATVSISAQEGVVSNWEPQQLQYVSLSTTNAAMSSNSLYFFKLQPEAYVNASQLMQLVSMSVSSSSNSSYTGAISLYAGIYTVTGSTLSLASSGSASYQFTNTSNNSTASLNGLRGLTLPLNVTMSPGNYWLGLISRNAAGSYTASNIMAAGPTPTYNGILGQAANATQGIQEGAGLYSTSISSIPSSVSMAAINQSQIRQAPYIVFKNQTW